MMRVTHVVIRFARRAGLVALFIVAATAGILSGVLFAYAGDLPQISVLDNYSPSRITRVYAADNQLIGDIPTALPAPTLPDFSSLTMERVGELLPKATVSVGGFSPPSSTTASSRTHDFVMLGVAGYYNLDL